MVVLLLLVALLLLPQEALAWGPITHLAHGNAVLGAATILGTTLQRILQRHRLAYLYGCVGADITQAKKYTRAEQAHCHSWRVGWQLLEQAASDAQRAFAWGYLTHLASDVFSHNHYVPTQLIVSYDSLPLRHVYWEARFDTLQDASVRAIVAELRGREFPDCDALVRDVVSRTLFSFNTDKRIFNSFIAIHDLDQWHGIMRRLVARSRHPLPPDVVDRYNAVCLESTLDMMQRRKRADNQTADPTGLSALTTAGRLRARLRALDRKGPLPEAVREQIVAIDARPEIHPGACCGGLPADPTPAG